MPKIWSSGDTNIDVPPPKVSACYAPAPRVGELSDDARLLSV